MSTNCYDRRPEPSREPIQIAGDLARRGGKLSIEAAKCIKHLEKEVNRLWNIAQDYYDRLGDWQEATGYSFPSQFRQGGEKHGKQDTR